MNIHKIDTHIYKIESFLKKEDLSILLNIFKTLNYERQSGDEFSYSIYYYHENKNISLQKDIKKIMSTGHNILIKLIKKLYNLDVTLNSMWAVMQLTQNNYINTHTDTHSDIQCVLHLNHFNHSGGILYLKENALTPKENTLYIFPWKNTEHSVTKVTNDTYRYSLSFWFSTKYNKDKNKNDFCARIDRNFTKTY